MKREVKALFFCLVLLMLVLPIVNSRELSSSEIDQLKDRVNNVKSNINDFEMVLQRDEIALVKVPNYYRLFDYENGSIIGYTICNKDNWLANYDSSSKNVVKQDFTGVLDWITRIFGGGVCGEAVKDAVLDITPARYFEKMDEFKGAKFAEDVFEGKDALKVTLGDYNYYYDWNTLLKLATVYQCSSEQCMVSKSNIERNNIKINQGIQTSEFDFFIPKGAVLCETDLKKALTLEAEINSTNNIAINEIRALTKEEWFYMQVLRKEMHKAKCWADFNYSDEDYIKYTKDIFNCLVDARGASIIDTRIMGAPGAQGSNKISSQDNLCVNPTLYRQYRCFCKNSDIESSNFVTGCAKEEYTFETQDYSCQWGCDMSRDLATTGGFCAGEEPVSPKPICVDSDGENYYVDGTVKILTFNGKYKYISGQDFCAHPKKLREWTCENNKAEEVLFNCPKSCLDGKCVDDDYRKYLNDSVKTYTAGEYACSSSGDFGAVVSDRQGKLFNAKENVCINKNLFREFECICKNPPGCTEFEIESQDYSCSSCDLSRWGVGVICEGEKSVNGQCIDSDGGKNYYAVGQASVTLTSGKIFESGSDICQGTTYLTEFYCDNNEIKDSSYECPKGCKDGACIR